MYRNFFICLGCVAFANSTLAADELRTVPLRFVTQDGKPAAGAQVWIVLVEVPTGVLKPPATFTADATGNLVVPIPETYTYRSIGVSARDAAGRLTSKSVDLDPNDSLDPNYNRVILWDMIGKPGRLTDASGQPVVGAEITPVFFDYDERQTDIGDIKFSQQMSVPTWEKPWLTVKSDKDGRFTVAMPARSGGVRFDVKSERWGRREIYAKAKVDLAVVLAPTGRLECTLSGVHPAALKGVEWSCAPPSPESRTASDTPGIFITRTARGKVGDGASITVPDLLPGRYEIWLSRDSAVPGLLEKQELQVTAGQTTNAILTFGPAAKVTGRVIDRTTGKGIGGVKLAIPTLVGSNSSPSYRDSVTTQADGSYFVYGPAGTYRVGVQNAPDGHSIPRWNHEQQGHVDPARVDVANTHAFADIALDRSVTLTGRVVRADGTPAAGATIDYCSVGMMDRRRIRADAEGRFAQPNLPADHAVLPLARLGTAVNLPVTIDLQRTDVPVMIVISEENAVRLTGRVVDARNRRVAGAHVKLVQNIRGLGRDAPQSMHRPTAATTTDREGKYSFEGLWPNESYQVTAVAEAFATFSTDFERTAAGKTHEFSLIKLMMTKLSVAGRVVDGQGKPLAGVEVFGNDGPATFGTKSGDDGQFKLTGFYDAAGFVFARHPGYRLTALPVQPSDEPAVTIVMAKGPRSLPLVPPEHAAAEQELTRHVLQLLWDNRDAFRCGGSAIQYMARIDLPAAKRWNEKEIRRTEGKTNYNRLIARAERDATLFNIAKHDIDEAIALLPVPGEENGLAETLALGEQLLPIDRDKSLRLAAEVVFRARKMPLPDKVWCLAQAGELAARAGDHQGGLKLLHEATELAQQLPLGSRDLNSMARGMVAARMAPYDWPRSKSLLESLKDVDEYNRFLTSAIARLAPTDLPKAKQLFEQFRARESSDRHDCRILAAARIAAEKPAEAVAIVASIDEPFHKFTGYLRMASLIAPHDHKLALSLIDKAAAILNGGTHGFSGWSGYGRAAGYAALLAYRATELGHPDAADFVVLALTLRSSGSVHGHNSSRDEQQVEVAQILALIDPVVARQLLECVAPIDEVRTKHLGRNRHWLIALASADPPAAMKLADDLIVRAKDNPGALNGFSQSGLVELANILTAKDRFRELSRLGGIIHERFDEE